MNTRNSDQLIHAFLQETRDELPERAYAAVRREIDKAPQRIVVGPWRTPFMDNVSRFAVPAFAVTLLVTLALAGMNVFGVKAPPRPGAPTSSPSVSTAQPTATPSVSVLSPAQVNTHLAAGTYGTTFPTQGDFHDDGARRLATR